MKKLLLLIATMSIVAPFASVQAAEIKHSVSEAQEVPPPPPDYEELDIPELIDLLNDQAYRLDLNFIGPVLKNRTRDIYSTITSVKADTKEQQIEKLRSSFRPWEVAFYKILLDELKAEHLGDPKGQKTIEGFEYFYILFNALINKLQEKTTPLPPLKDAIKLNDTAEVKHSASEVQEAPPPRDYEALDIPELIDLLENQYEIIRRSTIMRLDMNLEIRMATIANGLSNVKKLETQEQQIQALQNLNSPLLLASKKNILSLKENYPEYPRDIEALETFYAMFEALINKLPVRAAPLPPIEDAIQSNDLAIVQLWLNRPDYAPAKGIAQVAFGESIRYHKPDIVALFLKNNFDINRKVLLNIPADLAPSKMEITAHLTPLMGASLLGYKDIVTLLLDAGADTKITNSDGKTALDLAADDATRNLIINYPKALGKELSEVWAEDEQRKKELKAKATTPEQEPVQSSRHPLQLIAEYAGAELPAAAPASAASVSSSATAEPGEGTEPTEVEAGSDDDTTEYTDMPEVD